MCFRYCHVMMWQLWLENVDCSTAKTRFFSSSSLNLFPQKEMKSEIKHFYVFIISESLSRGLESGMSCRLVNKATRESAWQDFFTFPVFKFDLTLRNSLCYTHCALVRSFWKLIMQKSVQLNLRSTLGATTFKWNDNRHSTNK